MILTSRHMLIPTAVLTVHMIDHLVGGSYTDAL